jgi:hypothetical protein
MADRQPLVIVSGQIQQLQAGDTIPAADISGLTTIINNLTASLAGLYGTGVDGNVTLGAGTTTLARSMFYNNLTINSGGLVDTKGFQIFVKETLTGNNGSISRAGQNGSPGAGTVGGFRGTGVTVGLFPGSADGGIGGSASGTTGTGGNSGGGGGACPQEYVTLAGGAGGANNIGAGGGGAGLISRLPETSGRIAIPIWALAGRANGATAFGTCGAGGGAGAGGAAGTSGGGGGGSGGGYLTIGAKIVNCTAATFSITTKGGDGGAAAANGGSAGGGGGGMGGPLVLVYSVDNGASPPVTISTGGSGAAGTGTGSAGTAGGDGPQYVFKLGG